MRKAFTLVELLVMTAVIAILAAILFPVFSKARERAKQTQCASNLRQLGNAIEIYRNDFDGQYPYAYRNDSVRNGDAPSLPATLTAYVEDQSLWRCPSDTGETFLCDPATFHSPTKPFHFIFPSSYDYPGIGWPYDRAVLVGRGKVPIRKPAEAALLMEVRPWHGTYDRMHDRVLTAPGRVNVLLCDQHIAFVPRYVKDNWQKDAIKR